MIRGDFCNSHVIYWLMYVMHLASFLVLSDVSCTEKRSEMKQ